MPTTILGYRGLRVEQTEQQEKSLPRAFSVANGDLLSPGAAMRIGDSGFEDFIWGSSGPLRISDPRSANRGMYTDFCSFLVVHHGHIKIN